MSKYGKTANENGEGKYSGPHKKAVAARQRGEKGIHGGRTFEADSVRSMWTGQSIYIRYRARTRVAIRVPIVAKWPIFYKIFIFKEYL